MWIIVCSAHPRTLSKLLPPFYDILRQPKGQILWRALNAQIWCVDTNGYRLFTSRAPTLGAGADKPVIPSFLNNFGSLGFVSWSRYLQKSVNHHIAIIQSPLLSLFSPTFPDSEIVGRSPASKSSPGETWNLYARYGHRSGGLVKSHHLGEAGGRDSEGVGDRFRLQTSRNMMYCTSYIYAKYC